MPEREKDKETKKDVAVGEKSPKGDPKRKRRRKRVVRKRRQDQRAERREARQEDRGARKDKTGQRAERRKVRQKVRSAPARDRRPGDAIRKTFEQSLNSLRERRAGLGIGDQGEVRPDLDRFKERFPEHRQRLEQPQPAPAPGDQQVPAPGTPAPAPAPQPVAPAPVAPGTVQEGAYTPPVAPVIPQPVPPAGAAPVDPATGAPVAGAPVQQPGTIQPAVDAAIGQFPGFQGPVQSGYMWSGAQPQFPAPGGVMNPRLRAMNNWGRFNRPGLGQFPGAQPQPIEPGYSPAPQPQPITQTLPPEETF